MNLTRTITRGVIQGPQEILAQAYNFNGVVLRDDYTSIINDYRNKERPAIWNTVSKQYAMDRRVGEMARRKTPKVGWVNTTGLEPTGNAAPQQMPPVDNPNPDTDEDRFQYVRAIVGMIENDHFAVSLATQQEQEWGRTYINALADETTELLNGFWRMVHNELINGRQNDLTNPHAFNGLTYYLRPDHTIQHDVTVNGAARVSEMLSRVRFEALSAKYINRDVGVIMCSYAGLNYLQAELVNSRWITEIETVPGIKVTGVMCGPSVLPVIASPYINDEIGALVGETQNPDYLNYHLYDPDAFEWHGVVPSGGNRSFEPQFFDIRSHVGPNATTRPLIQQRLLLFYGTTYFKNLGENYYSLRVKVPHGTAFAQGVLNAQDPWAADPLNP